MAFPMNEQLRSFDVYPKVIAVGKETVIHIRQLGSRPLFAANTAYTAVVCAITAGRPINYPATGSQIPVQVSTDADGNIAFPYTFPSEQEYLIRFEDADGKRMIEFPVYAVDGELAKRYPYIGDLHMHTCRSDGREIPAVVSANYRRHGYDFFAITDHHRYYPSLEAIEAFRDFPTEFNIVPGEEIHLPDVYGQGCDFHYVNFGGEYSVNALIEDVATEEKGKDKKYRSIREDCPDVMTVDEYEEKMTALSKELQVPENIDLIPATVFKWIYDTIHDANGLAIFPHPDWITGSCFHVPDAFSDYVTRMGWFDAFEVLGGENYFEQNGFQTVKYYEDKARGYDYAIVGSTDSHSSYPTNKNAYICSTMVFAPENSRTSLISSIKDKLSVAIDTISAEFRLVGDMRLVRYACFLLKNYFPLHDEICSEEGRLMKIYITGTEQEREEALRMMQALQGRVDRQRKKYFDL